MAIAGNYQQVICNTFCFTVPRYERLSFLDPSPGPAAGRPVRGRPHFVYLT